MTVDGPSDSADGVAVVTVSYHSETVLPSFLASLAVASRTPLEVVIVDNLADSATQSLAESANARYLALPSNPGYGAGMNAGVTTLPPAVGWVLLSNPDVVLAPESIDRLLEVGRAEPDIGAVGPAVLDVDGGVYPSARAIPSLRLGIGHALFSSAWPSNPWSRRYRRTGLSERADVGWLSGSCLLVRRSAFDEIGGFDESFFMYFEDVDLGRRLSLGGYRNVYEPEATVVHSGAHSTGAESERMIDEHHRSARIFVGKKYPSPVLAPLRWVLTVGLSVRAWNERRRVRSSAASE